MRKKSYTDKKGQQTTVTETFQIKHITVDFKDHKIMSNGVELSIDFKAVEVLQLLIEHAGETVETNDFMDKVWHDKPSAPEVIPAAIARLRKMFKLAGFSEELIVTVHKVGYRFEPIIEKPEFPETQKASKHKLFKWLEIGLILALLISLFFTSKQHFSQLPKSTVMPSLDEAKITKQSAADVTQIYILRHTEKADDNAEDPELSTQGIAHALYWRSVLQHTQFDQVFTTDFKRNIQTANLLTTESSIRPELYYPMSFDVLKFINQIKGQRVLIIGHSNTIPDMVNRLIGETIYPPMSHENYDVLFIVTINKNGDTSSSMLHIKQPGQ